MKTEGEFKYFIDGKEVLYKDLQTMVRLGMTVNIDGLNVYYKSPQKENKKEETVNRLVEEELERQEQQDWDSRIDDIIGAFTEAEKRGGTIRCKPSLTVGIEEITKIMTEGKKENNGKIDYSEVDFDILDLMANRFNANKHKYPHGNMLKPIEEKQLLFALFRHLKKMIQPIDSDPETFEEHLSAILCNAQMVYQQRKLNKN